jgi:hypothetical protein
MIRLPKKEEEKGKDAKTTFRNISERQAAMKYHDGRERVGGCERGVPSLPALPLSANLFRKTCQIYLPTVLGVQTSFAKDSKVQPHRK